MAEVLKHVCGNSDVYETASGRFYSFDPIFEERRPNGCFLTLEEVLLIWWPEYAEKKQKSG